MRQISESGGGSVAAIRGTRELCLSFLATDGRLVATDGKLSGAAEYQGEDTAAAVEVGSAILLSMPGRSHRRSTPRHDSAIVRESSNCFRCWGVRSACSLASSSAWIRVICATARP